MTITKIAPKLIKKIKEGSPIQAYDWPSKIVTEKPIVRKMKDLTSYTNKEGLFSKKSGAVGWEYGFSVFFMIDEIYMSKSISGDYRSVNLGHKFGFKGEYKNNNEDLFFNISIDDKSYKSKSYKTKKFPKEFEYGFIASFHTHPKYYHENGESQYTFYSAQDISSLIYGNIPILGLIAGKKVWLACKTADSRMIPQNILNYASRIELEGGNEEVKSFVKSNMSDFGIKFYYGGIGGGLEKL